MTIVVHLPTSRATYYRADGTVAFTRRLAGYDSRAHTFVNEENLIIHLGAPLRQDGDTVTYKQRN